MPLGEDVCSLPGPQLARRAAMWPACERPRVPSRQVKGANADLGLARSPLVVTAGGVGFLAKLLLSQLPPRRLPMRQLKGAIRSAGQQMSDEAKSVRVVERPEKAIIKAFVDSPGPFPKTSPSFLVVSGAQGTGKTTMLKSLFAQYHDDGRWVLPVSQEIDPGGKLDLTDVVQQACRTRNLPQFLPSFQLIPTLLRTLSEKGSRESGGPLIVYPQLSTKNRGAPFTDDQCDALATEIGAFGRKLTYDYPLCKLVVELSVSLIADKIQELPGQIRASRVLPWCCNSG